MVVYDFLRSWSFRKYREFDASEVGALANAQDITFYYYSSCHGHAVKTGNIWTPCWTEQCGSQLHCSNPAVCDGYILLTYIVDTRKVNVEADPDTPQISLEEMLDELNISEDATGAEGASMVE